MMLEFTDVRAFRWSAVFALVAVATGCLKSGPTNPTPDFSVGTGQDSGAVDFGTDDRPPFDFTLTTPSQCAAPAVITPAMVPATGYLPVKQVDLQYVIDGDTSHFNFIGEGEFSTRFLQVNTEENHGPETTAFGTLTGEVIKQMMSGPHLFQVALQAKANAPTEPRLDAFGRRLGFVFMDGELLQTRIIREGWSAYYVAFGCAPEPMHSAMLYAEAEASAGKRGIWAPGHPTNYQTVFQDWIGSKTCRPNPFDNERYCN